MYQKGIASVIILIIAVLFIGGGVIIYFAGDYFFSNGDDGGISGEMRGIVIKTKGVSYSRGTWIKDNEISYAQCKDGSPVGKGTYFYVDVENKRKDNVDFRTRVISGEHVNYGSTRGILLPGRPLRLQGGFAGRCLISAILEFEEYEKFDPIKDLIPNIELIGRITIP